MTAFLPHISALLPCDLTTPGASLRTGIAVGVAAAAALVAGAGGLLWWRRQRAARGSKVSPEAAMLPLLP